MSDTDDGRTALIVGLSVGFGTAVFVGILVIIALICRKKLKDKDIKEKRNLEVQSVSTFSENPAVAGDSQCNSIKHLKKTGLENKDEAEAPDREGEIFTTESSTEDASSNFNHEYSAPMSTRTPALDKVLPTYRGLSLRLPLHQQRLPSIAGLPTYNQPSSSKTDKRQSYPVHRSASVLAQKRASEVLCEFREHTSKQRPYQTIPMSQALSHKQAIIDELKQNYPKNPIPKLIKTDTRSQEREDQYKSNWLAEQMRCNISSKGSAISRMFGRSQSLTHLPS